jgi:hypothetical protein
MCKATNKLQGIFYEHLSEKRESYVKVTMCMHFVDGTVIQSTVLPFAVHGSVATGLSLIGDSQSYTQLRRELFSCVTEH